MRPQDKRIDSTARGSPRLWFVARGVRCHLALACGALVHAHEIGTTRVSVLFHEGRGYDIEIVTDAAALVEKLEAVAGPPGAPASAQLESGSAR